MESRVQEMLKCHMEIKSIASVSIARVLLTELPDRAIPVKRMRFSQLWPSFLSLRVRILLRFFSAWASSATRYAHFHLGGEGREGFESKGAEEYREGSRYI